MIHARNILIPLLRSATRRSHCACTYFQRERYIRLLKQKNIIAGGNTHRGPPLRRQEINKNNPCVETEK
jgi:hypothetical protein